MIDIAMITISKLGLTELARLWVWRLVLSTLAVLPAHGHREPDSRSATIEITAGRDSIQIADPLKIEIVATAPAGSRLLFPIVDERLGDFDVLEHADRFDVPASDDPGRRKWIRKLTLETLETGALEIPAIEIVYVDVDANREVLRTNVYPVQVTSVLEGNVDATSFNDIRSVVDVDAENAKPVAWHRWAILALTILAASAVVAGLTIGIARRRRTITPADWARKRLNENVRPSIADVEQTLRIYLEQEFEFPATRVALEQIVAELNSRGVPPETMAKLETNIARIQQTKFAGLQMNDSQIEAVFNDAAQIVDELEHCAENGGA